MPTTHITEFYRHIRTALQEADLMGRTEDGMTVDDVLVTQRDDHVTMILGQAREPEVERLIGRGHSHGAAVRADAANVAKATVEALRGVAEVDEVQLADGYRVTVRPV